MFEVGKFPFGYFKRFVQFFVQNCDYRHYRKRFLENLSQKDLSDFCCSQLKMQLLNEKHSKYILIILRALENVKIKTNGLSCQL